MSFCSQHNSGKLGSKGHFAYTEIIILSSYAHTSFLLTYGQIHTTKKLPFVDNLNRRGGKRRGGASSAKIDQ